MSIAVTPGSSYWLPLSIVKVVLPSNVITGPTLSCTITVRVAVDVLPASSVAS